MKKKILYGVLVTFLVVIGVVLLTIGINQMIFYRSYPTSYNGLLVEYAPVEGAANTYDLTYRYVDSFGVYYIQDRMVLEEEPEIYHMFENVVSEKGNPENAIFAKQLPNSADAFTLVFVGTLLVLVPLAVVLVALSAAGKLDIVKEKVQGVLLGVLAVAVGLGFVWYFTGNFDLLVLYREIGPFVSIPAILIAVGIWQTLRTVLPEQKKKNKEDELFDF